MMRRVSVFLGLLAACLISSAQLRAEVVFIDFTGAVTALDPDPFLTGITVGNSVVGSFAYELTTVDTNPDPSTGIYPQTITDGFSVLVDGTHLFTSSDYEVEVNTADEFHVRVNSLELNGSPVTFQNGFLEFGSALDIFSTDALPATFPSFASFNFIEGRFTDFDFNNFVYQLDSLTQRPAPVPEPLSVLLGLQAAAGVGLVWWNRRRKKSVA